MLRYATMESTNQRSWSDARIVGAVLLIGVAPLVASSREAVPAYSNAGGTSGGNRPEDEPALTVGFVKTVPARPNPRECFPQRFLAMSVIDGHVQLEELARYPDRQLALREGRVAVRIDGKYGFADEDGRIVIHPLYDHVTDFAEGLAVARNDEGFGYVDRAGSVVIGFQYDYAYSFRDGLAGVKNGTKWGLIDRNGAWVKTPTYQELSLLVGGIYVVSESGEQGFVDSRGEIKRHRE
jgi:hypothetical protein